MALRHQEHVAEFAVRLAPHQLVIDDVGDLGAGEGRRDVQRRDLLRDVENAACGSAGIARARQRRSKLLRRSCVVAALGSASTLLKPAARNRLASP